MSMSKEEFDKVQLEPPDETASSDISDNLSDLESAITDREEDPDEEYGIDAIKYAYWLKKKNKPGQWFYGILWSGYLKTESEMDTASSDMNEEENLEDDLVYQFWTSFNPAEVPTARLKPGRREPAEPHSKALKYPHRFDCPTWRMKEWLKDSDPQRHLATFIARRQYINNNSDRPHLYPVPKKYSDYYVHKRELKKRRKEVGQSTENVAGPSTSLDPADKTGRDESSKPPRPRRSASKEKDKSGMDLINEVIDPPSDDLSGLSDLDTISDEDVTVEQRKAVKKSFRSKDEKKRKKTSPAKEEEEKSKKSKTNVVSSSSTSASMPAPATSRVADMDKIKKKSDQEPLFYAASPASTVLDAPTPHFIDALTPNAVETPITLFGEPASGIFDSGSLDQAMHFPVVDVIAPTPKPLRKDKPSDGDTVKSPTGAAKSRSRSPQIVAQPKQELSLLARTKVLLEQQKRDADAKKAAEPADPGPAAKPFSPNTEPKSPLLPSTSLGAVPVDLTEESSAPGEPSISSGSNAFRTTTSPSERKLDLANRPRYQQPTRMEFIDNLIQPTGKTHLPAAGKGASDQSAPYAKHGQGATTMLSPLGAAQRSPLNGGGKTPPHPASSAATIDHPPAPRNFPARPTPTGQSRKPVRLPRPTEQNGASNYTEQPRKIPQNAPAGPSRHGLPPWPTVPNQTAPVPVLDPRLRPALTIVDPRIAAAAPRPSIQAAPVYNPVADLRRTGPGPLPSPVSVGGRSPLDPGILVSHRSPCGGTRKTSIGSAQPVEKVCEFRSDVQIGHSDIHLRFVLFKGSTLPGAEHLNITKFFLNPLNSTLIRISMEEVDDVCVKGVMGLGAQVIEWSKVSHVQEAPSAASAGHGEYAALKDRISRSRKAFVTYTDYMPEHGVSCHYAIVLSSGEAVDFSQVGLGSWSLESIKIGLFIVALPLTSVTPPRLPNPVRPSADLQSSPTPPSFSAPVPALQSYGLDHAFFNSLTGTKVMKYPGEDGPTDFMHGMLTSSLKQYNAIPASDVDTLLVGNHRFSRTLKSSSVKANLGRRTAFYAYGPSLRLYPYQWGLTKIWQHGGLITFSPTFILRNPDAFSDIMGMIRSVDTWAAYVLPGVIEWFNQSKDKPIRCPDPAKAFETLTRSLYMDQHALTISGPEVVQGGGLAVSCAPPIIYDAEGCRRWMDWLRRVTDETEFDKLLELCKGISSRTFAVPSDQVKTPGELDLVNIERAQLEDLIAMRARPHLLPYRRYFYIGGTALADNVKAGMKEIEFVAPENFAAVLSGAL